MAANVTKANFQEEVLNYKGTVLVDFYADWCGPCKILAPILQDFSNERKDIKVLKVDVDSERELATKYGIYSIPTLIVFRDGQIVRQRSGFLQKQGLAELVK
ncbi:MAG: thioredoxin [Clostridiales bacterium]|jgi:thioredoxin 1|nr:thioredoxin [Clostridiales bacterium]